ncbi:pseudouridine synthase [Microbispora rosea]|uniref:pseudouridine synthase n=2 Tax=Microbispora rosea TaxID=58117 RepID=UPI003D89DC77
MDNRRGTPSGEGRGRSRSTGQQGASPRGSRGGSGGGFRPQGDRRGGSRVPGSRSGYGFDSRSGSRSDSRSDRPDSRRYRDEDAPRGDRYGDRRAGDARDDRFRGRSGDTGRYGDTGRRDARSGGERYRDDARAPFRAERGGSRGGYGKPEGGRDGGRGFDRDGGRGFDRDGGRGGARGFDRDRGAGRERGGRDTFSADRPPFRTEGAGSRGRYGRPEGGRDRSRDRDGGYESTREPRRTAFRDEDRGDRRTWSERGDRDARGGQGDRDQRSARGDRQPWSGRGGTDARSGRGDRDQRSVRGDRQPWSGRGGTDARSGRGDSDGRGGRGERDARSARPERGDFRAARGGGRGRTGRDEVQTIGRLGGGRGRPGGGAGAGSRGAGRPSGGFKSPGASGPVSNPFKTSRQPLRDPDFYDEDYTDERDTTEVPGGERLQKVLAQAGVASRRACEEMIGDGRVTVDGQTVRRFGARVDPAKQVIHVDGKRIPTSSETVYYALNKPIGVVSTMDDPDGRPCLNDYVQDLAPRLFHVGRLDTETEGLLLLTNDGELAHRLTHPSYGVQKKYWAKVPGPIPRDLHKVLRKGVELEDGLAKVDEFRVVQEHGQQALVEVVLHEGRKHIVRRMLEVVGHRVIDLARIEFGPVKLGRLKPGTIRTLTVQEIGELYAAVGL